MLKLLVLYGSYRRDRVGIRFAHYVRRALEACHLNAKKYVRFS